MRDPGVGRDLATPSLKREHREREEGRGALAAPEGPTVPGLSGSLLRGP